MDWSNFVTCQFRRTTAGARMMTRFLRLRAETSCNTNASGQQQWDGVVKQGTNRRRPVHRCTRLQDRPTLHTCGCPTHASTDFLNQLAHSHCAVLPVPLAARRCSIRSCLAMSTLFSLVYLCFFNMVKSMCVQAPTFYRAQSLNHYTPPGYIYIYISPY